MGKPVKIVYCGCAYAEVIPAEVRRQVLAGLTASGASFEAVDDLCGAAARAEPILARAADAPEARIIACHRRAVRWLFAAAGVPFHDGIEVLDMRAGPAGEILRAALSDDHLRRAMAAAGEAADAPHPPEPRGWSPWFPVIDYDRCTDCGQCLNFCLFDVYTRTAEDKVRVQNPANCKTNCPACARICPSGAIIFPKYKSGPISGADGEVPAAAGENAPLDFSSLRPDDVLEALRRRRGPPANNEMSRDRAIAERKACSCTEDLLRKLGVLGEQLGPASAAPPTGEQQAPEDHADGE